jgi:hypothetical protein
MEIDDNKWAQAWLDTPLWMQYRANSPTEAMKIPACAVKSREIANGMPAHFGKLVSYDEATDRIVVRGHDSAVSPRFVWVGTKAEYFRMWDCD